MPACVPKQVVTWCTALSCTCLAAHMQPRMQHAAMKCSVPEALARQHHKHMQQGCTHLQPAGLAAARQLLREQAGAGQASRWHHGRW